MFKHNPSRFVKRFPIFQNTRQTLINWYHYMFNVVCLAFPSPICLLLDGSLSTNEAHLASLHPDQRQTWSSWLMHSWKVFIYSTGKHDMKTDREKNCKASSALTHNILGAQSVQDIKVSQCLEIAVFRSWMLWTLWSTGRPCWFTQYAVGKKKKEKHFLLCLSHQFAAAS